MKHLKWIVLISYSIAITLMFAYLLLEQRRLIAKDEFELRENGRTAILGRDQGTVAWSTLRHEAELTMLLGEPKVRNGTGDFWLSDCGRYRFYLAPNATYIRVQAQTPERKLTKVDN